MFCSKLLKWLIMFSALNFFFALYTFNVTQLSADVLGKITLNGRLKSYGIPVSASKSMEFKVYSQVSGGNSVWTTGSLTVSVSSGVYFVDIEPQIDYRLGTYWIETIIDGKVLSPRQKLTSQPYALHSRTAEDIEKQAGQSIHFAIGTSSVVIVDATGNMTVTGNISASAPTASTHLATKAYVDYRIAQSTTGLSVGTSTSAVTNETDPVFTAHQAFTINTSSITNWNNTYSVIASSRQAWDTAVSWGNHASAGYAIPVSTMTGLIKSTISGDSYITGGNFGIGNSSPVGTLNVAKIAAQNTINLDTFNNGTNYTEMVFRKSKLDAIGMAQTIDGYILGKILFKGVNTVPDYSLGGAISVIQQGASAGYVPTIMKIYTCSSSAENLGITINSSGNVGIDTTNPAQKLEVNGKIKIGNDSNTATAGTIRWTGTNFEGYDGSSWKTLDVQSTSGTGGWTDDGSAKVYLTNSGRNVGIGTNSPAALLHMVKSNAVGGLNVDTWDDGTNFSKILLRKSDDDTVSGTIAQTDDGDVLGQITFQGGDNANNFATGGLITVTQQGISAVNVPSRMQLQTYSSTAFNTGITIDNAGNVGIGTTNPTGVFQVGGGTLTIIGGNVGVGTTNPAGLFQVGGGSLTVLSNGNVGVGTTNPGTRFEINGSANVANKGILYVNNNTNGHCYLTLNSIYGSETGFSISKDGTQRWWLYQPTNYDDFRIDSETGNRLTIQKGGNVGVGTTNPQGLFQVGGGSLTVLSNGNVGVGYVNPGDTLEVNGGVTSSYGFFHDRGDPAASDFLTASFTIDAAWHDLDLSSIVPAGAKTVLLYVNTYSNSADTEILFRKNGNANSANIAALHTQVANMWKKDEVIVACDTNRVIEYMANGPTQITLTVRGWWK